MLQFVIPKDKYSLCLVNQGKKDVHDVYLKYFGHTLEGTVYYEFEPIQMQTELLYGESYAILEEYETWDLDTTFNYEVLFTSDDGIFLKKFYRKNLDNVTTLDAHPLFTSAIWEIEETSTEFINIEDIIKIVSNDFYASKVPPNNSTYRYLLNRSDLFERFFEDLYVEMDNYYRGDNQFSPDKKAFADYVLEEYGVLFQPSESSNIILSNCAALMRKLKLTKSQMAEYFMEYIL